MKILPSKSCIPVADDEASKAGPNIFLQSHTTSLRAQPRSLSTPQITAGVHKLPGARGAD